MSLPWFPFNGKDFITDTLRLTTEAKGAYLMLMLDYYEQEAPPPDDDEVLANITGLTVERWTHHRRVIEPLFSVTDGLWVHERIRNEIRNGHEKHSAKVARVAAATEAAARKAAERRSVTVSVTDPKTDNKPVKTRHRSVNGPVTDSVNPSVTDTQTQTQTPYKDTTLHRAGAREAAETDPGVKKNEIQPESNPLNIDSPLGGAIPIDLWNAPPIDQALTDLFHAFARHHMDEGTFSSDWPALWRAHVEAARKPKKPAARARVEVNKRPELPPGRRVLISPEAFALAKEIEQAMGVEGQPITVGMPMIIEGWLAAWAPETILTTIRERMAQRAARGEEIPRSLRYFEGAIAQTHADLARPLPVATTSNPPQQDSSNARRQAGKSVPDAAKRLTAKLAALSGGGIAVGVGEGGPAGGPVQEIGGGRSGHLHRVMDAGDAGLPADGAGSRLPPGEGTGDTVALDANGEGGS